MTARELPRDLAGFRNFHEGKTVVVCGCGTSLSSLVHPERFLTIGVNDVGRLFQPDYLVVLNPRQQFVNDRFRHVEESRAKAIFTQLDLRLGHPHVVRFRLGKRGGTDLADPSVLHYTRNSPYVACCLAMHMGAKRIALIGVDFTHDHFFARTGRHSLDREVSQIDAEYRRLAHACAEMGIEVFNLSPSSRITAFPKISIADLERMSAAESSLRIVSYATTPVAGVPPVLARCITARTPHQCRAVWERSSYANGISFEGDVEYSRQPGEAETLLDAADVIVVHNGKIDRRHAAIIGSKPLVTLAHNYAWNVDMHAVRRGLPGLVVAQYQATLPEFSGWTPVPNPIPWWEPEYQPAQKDERITICFTPHGRHERYPAGHRLYWHSKGYQSTLRVLERVAARRGVALQVVGSGQVPHARSMEMKRRSHIVIDECVTGSYHRNSLEGLAAGCVVINGFGRLAALPELFRRCGETDEIPFVSAGLDDLEAVLLSLIDEGTDALLERGARNRRWLEAHWDFGRQWTRFWQPAIEQMLDRAPHRPTQGAAVPKRANAAVVIPFSGRERLGLLEATLDGLVRANPADVIVVEMGEAPLAEQSVRSRGLRHQFLPGGFHKARAMNAGAALVTDDYFFWLDADLLLPPGFLGKALEECRDRGLDCLVPWSSLSYLGANDTEAVLGQTKGPEQCAPSRILRSERSIRGGIFAVRAAFVREYGGICEEFRGVGGEDEAWYAKAALLGHAAVTQRRDLHIYHLFHPQARVNPNYRRNMALLREIRAIPSRERFLQRFAPAPETAPTAIVAAVNGNGTRLNLGCCDDIRSGFVNVDCVRGRGVDAVVDLSQRWPWADSSVAEVRAWDIIEHLPDKVRTMNELWRVLRSGATAEIVVPTTDGPGAFQDPTHVSFWNRRSFLYYEDRNPYRERFAASYGIDARFRVRSEHTDRTPDGPRLKIILEAVKG